MSEPRTLTLFADSERVATGDGSQIARTIVRMQAARDERTLLAFDDVSGMQVDIDRRDAEAPGTPPKRKPSRKAGRPKLGVSGHEVMLLPRHWEWLSAQPGGASVTLRKLVDKARREGEAHDRIRRSQGAAHSFMAAIAGNEPGYEEALRALYAGDGQAFSTRLAEWPIDVKEYALTLAREAFVTE